MRDAILSVQHRPARLSHLSWIPKTPRITYMEDQALVSLDVRTQRKKSLLTRQALQAAFPKWSLQIDRMPELHWVDSARFWFRHGIHVLGYDIRAQEGRYYFSLGDKAQDLDVHRGSMNAAFTQDRDLMVYDHNKRAVIPVATSNQEGIIYGQAVHRYEFGIKKGTYFSPSGKQLAYYRKDERMVSRYPLLDISTRPARIRTIRYPMSGQTSHRVRVEIYRFEDQATTTLQVPGSSDQYLTNLAWGPQGQFIYVAVLNRDQNHLRLEQYNARTGRRTKILFEERDDAYVEPEHPVYFIPGRDDEFLWLSERDGFQHIYRYDTTGNLLDQLTRGSWKVLSILGFSEAGQEVVFQATRTSPLDDQPFRVDIEGGRPKRLCEEQGVYEPMLSSDGRFLLNRFSNPNIPYKIDAWEVASRSKLTTIHDAPNPLADYRLGATRLIELQAADASTTLYGRLILPPDFDAAHSYPALVYVYGGPHYQMVRRSWLYGSWLWHQYMAQRGYVVFSLDNRGSLNRGLDFEQVTYRQLGTVERADQMKGLKYLNDLAYVDDTRIGVHGWSFGGFMTASLLCHHPGAFAVGVAGGAVIDWKFYEVMYGERYMDQPGENPEGYAQSSLLNHIEQLEDPLLLIHGMADDVVLPQHGLAFIDRAEAEDIAVDYMPYPGQGHHWGGIPRLHLYRKITGYLDQHLSPSLAR